MDFMHVVVACLQAFLPFVSAGACVGAANAAIGFRRLLCKDVLPQFPSRQGRRVVFGKRMAEHIARLISVVAKQEYL